LGRIPINMAMLRSLGTLSVVRFRAAIKDMIWRQLRSGELTLGNGV
jgi:hypothetical protein